MPRCHHTTLELTRQYAFFSWYRCKTCDLRKMIQTYPHPKQD
jgi:hypothetical protein